MESISLHKGELDTRAFQVQGLTQSPSLKNSSTSSPLLNSCAHLGMAALWTDLPGLWPAALVVHAPVLSEQVSYWDISFAPLETFPTPFFR